MWTINQTEQLASDLAAKSFMSPVLLSECDAVAKRHDVTGTQTYVELEPDEDGDLMQFFIVLRSDISERAVTTGYVLREYSEHVNRAATVAEAVAELAHAGAFGDRILAGELIHLVGEADAKHLFEVGSRHL